MRPDIQAKIADLVERRSELAFLMDFDGTMVDLVPNPSKIDVPLELVKALRDLSLSTTTALAIITGRALGQIDSFLGDVYPSASGSHGAEFRPKAGGAIEVLAKDIPVSLSEALLDIADRHSCFVEDKGSTLSFHLPFTKADMDITEELDQALGVEAKNYCVRRVGRTYEVLQRGMNKGLGIRHFMTYPGFAGRRPIYIGDDTGHDDSLGLVPEMGGELIGLRHMHHDPFNSEDSDDLWQTKDVRALVIALALAEAKMAAPKVGRPSISQKPEL